MCVFLLALFIHNTRYLVLSLCFTVNVTLQIAYIVLQHTEEREREKRAANLFLEGLDEQRKVRFFLLCV